jgi:hypothetical protein
MAQDQEFLKPDVTEAAKYVRTSTEHQQYSIKPADFRRSSHSVGAGSAARLLPTCGLAVRVDPGGAQGTNNFP